MAGHSPTARNALIVGRTQAAATQPIPQALLEFEPPSATRTEGSEAAAQKIVTAVVPAATALTAVSAAGRGQVVTVQPMPPALLEFEFPTAALLEAPVKPAARSVLWLRCLGGYRLDGGCRPVSDRYGGERRRPCRVASGDQRRAAA